MAKKANKEASNSNSEGNNAMTDATATDTGATDFSGLLASLPPVPITINDGHGTEVDASLPRKWCCGMTHDDDSAKTTDTHNARQFSNNENANAKARAIRYAKDHKSEDAPKGLDYYLARWAEYESDIGRERMSTGLKLKLDAAWKAWHVIVKEHNAAVTAGQPPVLVKAGNKTLKVNAKERESISARLLEMPQYEKYVAAEYEKLLAEREADKGKSAPAESVNATADIL
jgi:hypothetical protein